ncbi:Casein kinase II subunit beta-1 [Erysiphe necator]|uniref:Casein kinase II subunit beta n=1 Tax=Uncinula necator TaxID=52586 RepID=A0A0B1NY05_UNCNE|nr:Casein kinase II subunit beta-1 [Erysiphe necator]KHJ31252.1 putative casein kinase ii subunit beta-1 [Erysiphe necator]
MSISSCPTESWISSFCALTGHEYFAEISEEFILDDFNLTGLQTQVGMYKEALEMILDIEPEEEDDDDDEEEEDEGSVDVDGRTNRRSGTERRHSRVGSDLSTVELCAELLYGLIHQRFVCSRTGIQQMLEKYETAQFGYCPRTNCDGIRTLPIGLSDVPGEDTVKLFCPSCLDVYVPPSSRYQTVDGAFFGRTFAALFMLTFPEIDLTKKVSDPLSGSHEGDTNEKINGMNASNLAPGLGEGKIYQPKIFGFKVSERARSGPRMRWLRDRPTNIKELDEIAACNKEELEASENEDVDPSNGSRVMRSAPLLRKGQRLPGGILMSVGTDKRH